MQNQTFSYPSVGGTGNAITLTNTPPKTSLVAGQKGTFLATAGNTTAVTINEDGLGSKNVKKINNGALAALVANDLINGGMYDWLYDGTQYQIKALSEGPFVSGALRYLGTATASSSATVDLTSLLSSTYDDYMIILDGVLLSNTANIAMRCSPDNSTFDAGSNYYSCYDGSASNNTAAGSSAKLTPSMTPNPGRDVSGQLLLYNVNSSALYKHYTGMLVYLDNTSSTVYNISIGGLWHNSSNILLLLSPGG